MVQSQLDQFEFALGCLSLIGSICIIASFIFFRELRKHPLSIICWAALSDFIFVFIILLKEATSSDLCFLREYKACVSTLLIHVFGLAGVSWAGGALSMKILINAVRPFAATQQLQKLFHLFIWPFCILMAAISWIRQDGSIDDDRCAKVGKIEKVHAEFYAPVVIYFFLSVIAFTSAVSRMRALQQASNYRNKVVLRLLAYVIALPICWLGPLVYRFYISSVTGENRNFTTCERLNHWKTISMNLLGFVNAVIWISSPDFRRAVSSRFSKSAALRKQAGHADDDDNSEELDGEDINQIGLVLRNNMLTCSLIGVREGLQRLRTGRRRLHNPGSAGSITAALVERSPLGALAGASVTDSILFDAASSSEMSADETASDMEGDELPVVEAAISSPSSSSSSSSSGTGRHVDHLYSLRRGHYFGSDTFAVQPQAAAAQNHLDSSQVPLFSSPFVCCVFAPKVFHNLRLMAGFGSIDFEESVAPSSFLRGVAMNNDKMSQGGASGAFFAKSPCKRFILKTIPVEESDALLAALPWYYEHLTKYPKSLLCRLIGLYRITTPFNTLHVLVMQNLFGAQPATRVAAPSQVFDLKGSWIDRRASVGAAVQKDMDLGSRVFNLQPARRLHILKQLTEDSKLLRDLGIMDYSLLVGIFNTSEVDLEAISTTTTMPVATRPNPRGRQGPPPALSQDRNDIILLQDGKTVLVIGIIDMLQPWNGSKRMESFIKSRLFRKDPKGISAVEPKYYSKRFRAALFKIFQ